MRSEDMNRTHETGKWVRLGLLVTGYAGVLAIALFLAYELRFDFAVPAEYQNDRNIYLPWVVLAQILSLSLFRQFGSLLTYFSVPDLLRIVGAAALSNVALATLWYVSLGEYAPPRGVILADFVFAVVGLSCFRLMLRVYRERFAGVGLDPALSDSRVRRLVIVGAGDAGARLAHEAASRPQLGLRPICFLDDDKSIHGRLIHGIPVSGNPDLLMELAAKERLDSAVIALPSATGRRVREIVSLASEAKLKVEIVPSVSELATGRVQVTKIRPVDVIDLLGRDAVELDSAHIAELVKDRVVMVTGAGGSIGSELCRQIARLNPKRLLMVEQSEGSLFEIEQELNDTGLGAIALPLVADILDGDRMASIFARFQPAVVFHAAAHKHVFMMERQPSEALRNNSVGTRLLARMASAHGVGAFVLISTDKAINPTSVMGATKRLAEIHLQALQAQPGNRTKFIAVRFGNVLGSSGSVVPIFKRQIANGGPVTVTHPDVTRYFMTIPEAVGLVLQASVLGQGGEIFVLDMGQPVKIVDLARQMIELSGLRVDDDIEIKFTGLKPGEKLYEELQHHSEDYATTAHPRIMRLVSQVSVREVSLAAIAEERALPAMESNELKQLLKRLVPEYTPFLD